MTITRRCAECGKTFRQHRRSIKRQRHQWAQSIHSGFRRMARPCHNRRLLKLDTREHDAPSESEAAQE